MKAGYSCFGEERIMAKVFMGPWYGELGWELHTWQAYCRAEAKKFDKVCVSSFPSMEPLYQDFADEFIPHRHPTRALDWRDLSEIDYDMPGDVDVHIKPHKQYRVTGQDFIQFGNNPLRAFACLVHARNISKGSNKNYPQELWEELVKMLPGRVASIGTGSDLHVRGTDDLRDAPLGVLTNYMAGCLLTIGQSSGVMHLAALCGSSLVVWGDGKTYFGETLEKRYKETWNPLGARVEFVFDDKWQPHPQEVLRAVRDALPGIPPSVQAAMMNRELTPTGVGEGAILQIPVGVEPEAKKDREVSVLVDSEMATALEAAMNSGRWILAVSYINPQSKGDPRLLHCWQTHDYPREELISTVEHWKTEIADKEANPADIRQQDKAPAAILHVGKSEEDLSWR